MTERTLAIIKPDAVERRLVGRIIQRIEDEGFQIRAMRRVHLTRRDAEGFFDRQGVDAQLRAVTFDQLAIGRGGVGNHVRFIIDNPPLARPVLIKQVEETLEVERFALTDGKVVFDKGSRRVNIVAEAAAKN
jgi:nucleoside diphosphate kinase